MEIPEKGPWQHLQSPNRLVEELQHLAAGQTRMQPKGSDRDTVNLTASGREFKTALQHAHTLPDIREDRVAQLKRQLEEGTYRVKGHRIAVNLISETLENNTILKRLDAKA